MILRGALVYHSYRLLKKNNITPFAAARTRYLAFILYATIIIWDIFRVHTHTHEDINYYYYYFGCADMEGVAINARVYTTEII